MALGGRTETDRHQIVIDFQVTDQRVSFDKGELFLSHGPGQEFTQITQMPGIMGCGRRGSSVELGG